MITDVRTRQVVSIQTEQMGGACRDDALAPKGRNDRRRQGAEECLRSNIKHY